ncbi:hypothetical protein HO133_007718 [Letharia lupina]|uniref:Uncharacterized protein n=1 Tax=Letharia lupina TaxID=560253 RepID=A0A8H6FH19_9LECA|nr:uncharacterized protein HO133_007718 [Letharia lupina]KAF6227990.1 hypothetical protein HO133_007718 [Letharia lupina]
MEEKLDAEERETQITLLISKDGSTPGASTSQDLGSSWAEVIQVQYYPQQNQLPLKTERYHTIAVALGLARPLLPERRCILSRGVHGQLIDDLPNHDIDFAANMGTEYDSRFDQSLGLARSNHHREEVVYAQHRQDKMQKRLEGQQVQDAKAIERILRQEEGEGCMALGE